MAVWQFVAFLLYAAGLTAGQILFKLAAKAVPGDGSASWWPFAQNFSSAIVLYALLSAAWVALLRVTPLSAAYPFVALSLVMTMGAGVMLFGESVSPQLVIGGGLIVAGLLVIAL